MSFDNWVDKYFFNSSVDPKILLDAYNSAIGKNYVAVYAISANPPTWGHGDIVMRASSMFSHIYWLVAENPHKSSKFTSEEKIYMLKEYIKYYKLENVTVDVCRGATIKYAKDVGAKFMIRGLRSSSDFQAELELAAGNRGIDKKVETMCMLAKPHFATISSSIVRELATIGESIDQYVLPSIADKIISKFKN